MSRIFINYRRADTAEAAKKTYKHLVKKYGDDAVFFDAETIEIGEQFLKEILYSLAGCDFFLLFIGMHWLTMISEDSETRLHHKDDLLRKEIEYALEDGIEIIPILVDGASMPTVEDLPESIASIAYCQALKYQTKSLATEIGKLIQRIEKIRSLRDEKRKELEEAVLKLSQDDRLSLTFFPVLIFPDIRNNVLNGMVLQYDRKVMHELVGVGCSIIPQGTRKPYMHTATIDWKIATDNSHITTVVSDIITITALAGNRSFEKTEVLLERQGK